MIKGISHITFTVRDLEKTSGMFRTVFGAEEIYSSGDETHSVSREKFLLAGGLWIALMEGTPAGEKTYDHVAFSVPESELGPCMEKILGLGLEIKPGRKRVPGEGRSVYFYDYDNHLFELHAGSLADRLNAYKTKIKNGDGDK